jgi:RNA polymerase subunit RPABC4/transcription elongation factor Spt4
MICKNCEYILEKENAVCPSCGMPVDSQEEEQEIIESKPEKTKKGIK